MAKKELEKKPYSYQCNTCKFNNALRHNDLCEKGDWYVAKDDNGLIFIPSVKKCKEYFEMTTKLNKTYNANYKKWVSSQREHCKERVKLKHELRRKGTVFSSGDSTDVLKTKLKDGGFMGFTGD